MNEIRLTPGAEKDLEESLDWYRKEDPSAPNRFLGALDLAYRAIIDNPTRYPKLWGGFRFRIVDRFPFSVVYRILADQIEVVAVAHAKRKPGYWRHRNGHS